MNDAKRQDAMQIAKESGLKTRDNDLHSWLSNAVKNNMDKEFVQRIANPNTITPLDNEDKTTSTHSMASGEDNKGRGVVYPEVVNIDGELKRLSRQEAVDYSKKTGEYMLFPTVQEAETFSKSYKSLWKSKTEEEPQL